MLADISNSVLSASAPASGTASPWWVWGLYVLLIAGLLEIVFCTVGAILKSVRSRKADPSD